MELEMLIKRVMMLLKKNILKINGFFWKIFSKIDIIYIGGIAES